VRELPGRLARVLPGEPREEGAEVTVTIVPGQPTRETRTLLTRTGPAVPAVLAAVGGLVLLLPAALATAPVAGQRTERGEVAAVARACASFAPGDVALAVDPRSRNEWPQVLRGTCGVPSASIVVATAVGRAGTPEYAAALRTAVERQAARVRAAGGRPVLVAAGGDAAAQDTLTALGGTDVRRVTHVRTPEDERVLTTRPDGAQVIDVELWTAVAP